MSNRYLELAEEYEKRGLHDLARVYRIKGKNVEASKKAAQKNTTQHPLTSNNKRKERSRPSSSPSSLSTKKTIQGKGASDFVQKAYYAKNEKTGETRKIEPRRHIEHEEYANFKYDKNKHILQIGDKVYTNVKGIITNRGRVRALILDEGDKTVQYDLWKQQAVLVQNRQGWFDVESGKGKWRGGGELNPLHERDKKELEKLGVRVQLNEAGKAASDWYWKQKEAQASRAGADELAYSVAGAVNAQYKAEYVHVKKEGNKYILWVEPSVAKNSKIDEILVPNAFKRYSRMTPYARVKKEGDKWVIEEKPIEEPAYLSSKYLSSDMPQAFSVGAGGELFVTFQSGKKKAWKNLSPEKKKAIRAIAGDKLQGIEAQIAAEAGKKLGYTPAVRLENGKYVLPKMKEYENISLMPLPIYSAQQEKKKDILSEKKKQMQKEAQRYKPLVLESYTKWFYAPSATAGKIANTLAELGADFNKAFSDVENAVGIDIPFLGTVHGRQALKQHIATEKKLRELDKLLDVKATLEARKFWHVFANPSENPVKRLGMFLGTPVGAVMGGVAGGELLAGTEIGATASSFVKGGAFFTGLEEAGKSLSGHVPFSNQAEVKAEFLAGGVSTIGMEAASIGLAQKLKVIPFQTNALNAGKRLATATGSGMYGGALYSATKQKALGEKLNTKKVAESAITFGAFGAAFEGVAIGMDAGVLPTVEGTRIQYRELVSGKEHVYSGVSIRLGKRAWNVVGLQDMKPVLGGPKIDVSRGVWEFPVPVTPSETAALEKPLRQYAARKEFSSEEVKAIRKAANEWAKKGGKTIRPEQLANIDWDTYYRSGRSMLDVVHSAKAEPQVSLEEVLSQSPLFQGKEKAVVNVLTQEKAGVVIFGSTPQKMYMGEAMTRNTMDVDLMALNKPPEKLAENIARLLKKVYGKNIRVSPERPSLVEIRTNGKWHHAFDIHAYTGEYSSVGKELSQQWVGYGLPTKAPKATKEGWLLMDFGEQGARKGVSSLTPRPFCFAPEAHRLKDVVDFVDIGKFVKAKEVELFGKEAKKLVALRSATVAVPSIDYVYKPRSYISIPTLKDVYSAKSSYSYTCSSPSVQLPNIYRPSSYKQKTKEYTYTLPEATKKYSYSYTQQVKGYTTPSYSYRRKPAKSQSYSYKPKATEKYAYSYKPQKTYSYTYSTKEKYSYVYSLPMQPQLKKIPEVTLPLLFKPEGKQKPLRLPRLKKPEKYRPSLGGLLLGVKSSRPPELVSGIGIRPVVETKKKKKKKKRGGKK